MQISIDDYFKDPQTGKDRRQLYPDEFTQEIYNNAVVLLQKVSAFLTELGIDNIKISSGWRPSEVNKSLPNSAKKSLHMIGSAIDIADTKDQQNGRLVASRPDLLRKYGLWLEDLEATKGNNNWFHLDVGNRTDRSTRIFKP